MNALIQQSSLLVGSNEEIERIEKLNSCCILAVSDTHGAVKELEAILRAFCADCDAFVFMGDGVSDVLACLERAAQDEELLEILPPVVAFVRGNGDADSYFVNRIENDNIVQIAMQVPDRQMLKIAGRNLLIVHGHRHGVDLGTETLTAAVEAMDADIVFFGHTHRPFFEEINASLILNPGSISRPRGGFPPSFAVVSFPGETERYHTEFFTIKNSIFGGFSFEPLRIQMN
ncbi:MAG: metallophosphoesterase [Treponema sp.]|nr:metallophosphoesterase [Treponema sp.]